MRRASLVTAIILVMTIAATTGCAAKPAPMEKAVIGVFDWPGCEPIYVAQEKGFFRDEGLDVTLQSYASGPQALDAAMAGKADFATAADTPIVRAILDNKPALVVATICTNDRAFMIVARKDSGISSVAGLRGKKVGMTRGTSNEFFLTVYLVTSHVDPKDVMIVDMPIDRGLEALAAGGLDAMSMSLPASAMARDRLGANAVVLSDPGIYAMTFNLVVSREFAAKNPERIKKALRSLVRANAAVESGAIDPRSLSSKYIGAASQYYEREWGDFHCQISLDQGLILNLEDQARWMLKASGGGKVPKFLDNIYTQALKEVSPDAVSITGR